MTNNFENKKLILIADDDPETTITLQTNFQDLGYRVDVVTRGAEVLNQSKNNPPNLIILETVLPDMDGFDVFKTLRGNIRTGRIPVFFLTKRDQRADKLQGLALGAVDYIIKPFDMDELILRVRNVITRSVHESLMDPRSGLPSGPLIEDKLRQVIREKGWAFMDIGINHYTPFKESYGFIAGDDVIRFAAMLFKEILDEKGMPDDFIGHVGSEYFFIITKQEAAPGLKQEIKHRFPEGIITHYNFLDRQNGFISVTNDRGEIEKMPLMSIAVGTVSTSIYQFSDIREITEIAAEARRMDS